MKKTYLLAILFFHMTFVFGQTPIAEDEKVIQYNTNWGAWITAPNNNNILFSARLKYYDKQKKLYAWDVRYKVTKMPIAFEWKITNQVFTGANDAAKENDGYYTSATFDSKDNTNSMNGSGFAIFSASKTTLYYQIRNVCYEFDGREPNCGVKGSKAIVKNNKPTSNQNSNNSINSLSVEGLENMIMANLKRNLKNGSFYYDDYYQGVHYEGDINVQQIDVIRDPSAHYFGSGEPNTLYIFYYLPGESSLFGEKFIDLKIEKRQNRGANILRFAGNDKLKTRERQFLYDFGANDVNFFELQNAIDALKNPNRKLDGTSNKSVNGQNKGLTKQTENSLVQTEANKNGTGSNNYTSGRELNFNLGKINNGETHSHSFRLSKNVKSATANCGCITVDTNIKVPNVVLSRFHGIANYKGPFAKSIAVTYEDGTTEILYLKGELL